MNLSSSLSDTKARFLQIADDFTFVNPHLHLTCDWFGERCLDVYPTEANWEKWKPSEPTSPHWYGVEHFDRLVSAYISHDAARDTERTVRAVTAEFRGLSNSGKQKRVLEAIGLQRAPLTALVNGDGKSLDRDALGKWLNAMKAETTPVKPEKLGIIGRGHIMAKFAQLGWLEETFQYRKITGEVDGVPWVFEAAFAGCPDADYRRIITGVNWSPAIINPFRELGPYGDSLDTILAEQRAGRDDPVILLLHLACPRVSYTDRGKSSVVLDMDWEPIIGAIRSVTKRWAKQRKAEERDANARARRWRSVGTRRDTIKKLVFNLLPESYSAVSNNNRLPALARQLMYEVRRRLQTYTQEALEASYFTQTLLPRFMREYAGTTADWDVVYDARGHIAEPHTEIIVPLGTLDVRQYLQETAADDDVGFNPETLYPTHGPANRFGAIFLPEKEGFFPLYKAARLAEWFDLAIMPTKGLSTTACRQLVDRLCGEHGIPLLVLHDLDKAGFSIKATFSRNTERFAFKHKIEVVDIGLRLEDARTWNLESERYYSRSSTRSIAQNLRRNGATTDEIDFIANQRSRVELNAFRSADLIHFIESKLTEHGIKKVIPDAQVLEAAYRRALKIEYIRDRFEPLQEEAAAMAKSAKMPAIKRKLAKALKDDPAMPWDQVITGIARDNVS